MRVVVAHNHYRTAMPSGENEVVRDEVQMLESAGLEVRTFFKYSDDVQHETTGEKLGLAVSPTYARTAVREFRALLLEFRPHLVHLHNPVPLLSPWIIRVAHNHEVPVIQTVHNYRHSCPGSTSFFRDGQVCEDCLGKRVAWPALAHGCYRSSRAQTLAMVTSAAVHHRTWQLVERFLPVSEFVGRKLVEFGIPLARITVRPNAVSDHGCPTPPGKQFLFVGRLTSEKGISLLLESWRLSGLGKHNELVVVGDGPERELVHAAGALNVQAVGRVDRPQVKNYLDQSGVVIIPSLCYEGFPRLLAEAFERGRPVASTSLGALGDWVTPDVGWTSPAAPEAFGAMLREVGDRTEWTAKGAAARRVFERRLNNEASISRLLEVYEQVAAASAIPGRTRTGGQE